MLKVSSVRVEDWTPTHHCLYVFLSNQLRKFDAGICLSSRLPLMLSAQPVFPYI